jgi:hypothetical protein
MDGSDSMVDAALANSVLKIWKAIGIIDIIYLTKFYTTWFCVNLRSFISKT